VEIHLFHLRHIKTSYYQKSKKRQNLPNIMMFFSIARSIVWVIIVKVSGEDQQRVIYLQIKPHIHKLIVTSTTTTSEKVKDIFSKKCSFWWGRKIRHDMLFVIVKYLYCAWLDLLRWRFFGRKKLTRNEKKSRNLTWRSIFRSLLSFLWSSFLWSNKQKWWFSYYSIIV